MRRLRSNYDFLYRRFGKDGLKLIEEMSREYGLSVAQRAKTRLANNDLASVAEYLLRIFDTVARGRDVIIPRPRRIKTESSLRWIGVLSISICLKCAWRIPPWKKQSLKN